MGNTQDLIDRTTINFPRSVEEKEVENVLEYIVKSLGGYSRIWGNFSGHFMISKEQTEEKYLTKIEGMIFQEKGYVLTNFSFLRDEENLLGRFSGMGFDTGYDLDELPQKEIEFYDLIRKHLEKYFDNF